MSSPQRAMRRSDQRAIRAALAAAPDPGPDQQQAVMLAAALSLALRDMPLQPGCVRCVRAAKTAEAAGGVVPGISQAITFLPDVGPVCYGHFGG